MVNSKKAAMEMSVGTIVTIVLLMTVLILGLVLVRTIFSGAVENISGIDQAVKNEINKLFSEDTSRKVVVYPSTRKITIQKGEQNLGFGFSIRNIEQTEETFSYDISAVEASCNIQLTTADNYITLGKSRTGVRLSAGSFMEDPIFVRFGIPETAPPCQIRYAIEIESSQGLYGVPIDVDIEIRPS